MSGIRILVTGAGSVMGFDAVRILRELPMVDAVIAANVSSEFPARSIADEFVVSPDFYFARTHTEDQYIDFLLKLTRESRIDAVIPLSIFELDCLSRNVPAFEGLGARCIVEEPSTVTRFADKLATARFVQSIGGHAPDSWELADDDHALSVLSRLDLPLIVKPRFGYGSKAISILRSPDDIGRWLKARPEKHRPYIAQRYLEADDQEYSCSIVFGADGNPSRTHAMLRQKVQGITMCAKYDAHCHIVEDYLATVLGPRLEGRYALNPQVRIDGGRPTVFEINPRFGAGESLRRLFGYDAYDEILSEYYSDEPARRFVRYGTAMRAYSEVLLPSDQA